MTLLHLGGMGINKIEQEHRFSVAETCGVMKVNEVSIIFMRVEVICHIVYTDYSYTF